MSKAKKNGPITAEEKKFISLNLKNMSANDIAEELGRNPETIEKEIRQLDSVGTRSEILDLKKRQDWKQIQAQFTEEEIEVFKAHWNGVVQQFSSEIYYTESLQIIAAIKHDILSNRILNDQMKIKAEISRLENELEDERKQDKPDKNKILSIENQISSYCIAENVNGKEFRESSSKLMAVLKDLKALRSDRISRVEDMKKSFSSFMKSIIEDQEIKRNFGGWIEKHRLATEKEYKRLGNLHLFANQELDRPILNSETVYFTEEDKEGK